MGELGGVREVGQAIWSGPTASCNKAIRCAIGGCPKSGSNEQVVSAAEHYCELPALLRMCCLHVSPTQNTNQRWG